MDENQVGATEPPWFQSTLLWGSVSAVIAIVLAVLAAALKDLRWLLFIAWPFAIIAVREFSRTRHSPKPRYWAVGGAIISGIILLSLYHFLEPSSLNEYGSRIVVTRGSTERPDNDHILYKFWLT